MKEKKKKEIGFFGATIVAMAIIILGYSFYSIGCWWYHSGRRRAVAGIREPIQQDVTSESICFTKNGWDIDMKYICSYDIEALVLHTKEYSETDNLADSISPLDLLLGWGTVAEVNEKIDYEWDHGVRKGGCPDANEVRLAPFDGDVEKFVMSFSNNHLIPAEKNVEKDLLKVRRGDHIRIRGYLVNVDGVRKKDGQGAYWYTSTVRTDYEGTGCEIIYVTNIDWIDD